MPFSLYSSSRIPVIRSRPPNNFWINAVSRTALSQEESPAAVHPATIAGNTVLIFRSPCLLRNQQEMNAAGRKNNRLILRASWWDIPAEMVSHSISKLPPPTPIPDRKPRTVLMTKRKGRESNINIEYLPIRLRCPVPGEAISPGFFYQRFRQDNLRLCCRSDRETLLSREDPQSMQ